MHVPGPASLYPLLPGPDSISSNWETGVMPAPQIYVGPWPEAEMAQLEFMLTSWLRLSRLLRALLASALSPFLTHQACHLKGTASLAAWPGWAKSQPAAGRVRTQGGGCSYQATGVGVGWVTAAGPEQARLQWQGFRITEVLKLLVTPRPPGHRSALLRSLWGWRSNLTLHPPGTDYLS